MIPARTVAVPLAVSLVVVARGRFVRPDDGRVEVVLVGSGELDSLPAADVAIRAEVDLGFPDAANLGAAAATGDLLLFATGDTEFSPGWWERVQAVARSGADAVVGGPEGWFARPAGLLVRRGAFETVGGFDGGFYPGSFEAEHLVRMVRRTGGSVRFEPDWPIFGGGDDGRALDLREHIDVLGRRHLDALWSLPSSAQGAIDEPGADRLAEAEQLEVFGWALDRNGPLEEVVVLGGNQPASGQLGRNRSDVVARWPAVPGSEASGWAARVDVAGWSGELELRALGRRGRVWHEFDRRELRVYRRPRGTLRRRVAAFTIVQNEPLFLPVWLRHYRRELSTDDLFVLDHDTNDGSTADRQDATVVPVHRAESFDHSWLRSTVERFQRFLLQSYDVVLFAEVDELLFVDPKRAESLAAYIDDMTEVAARATGWNVVQADTEGAWDPDRPVLDQRRWWHRATAYDKVLIATRPLRYEVGFHRQTTVTGLDPDPDLMLLHLHRVDRDRCLARHRNAAARAWSRRDVELGYGFQNRVVEGEHFTRWYGAGEDLGDPVPQEVPAHLRGVV